MAQIVKVSLALFVFSLINSVALAQVRNSTITGVVTDQSGAVVSKAIVTVTNQLTNEAVKTQSGAVGEFSVPYLAAGRYAVSIDAHGFKTYRENDVAVETGVTVQVNAKLAVGVTSEVVQVAASTAQLQTESSTVTGAVETQEINNLPNINSNPLYYATLSAGVTPSPVMYNAENLGVGYADRQQYSAIRVNGGMLGVDDVQLDGVPVQGSGWHETTVMPNRDALQEVTVATNDLSADLGGGQAIIQMVTKNGTNNFHGDLYYNLRNEELDANGLANDMEGIPRGKYRVDEAGGSVGGPVIFPKLFNGRNKVFFFAAYNRLWNTEPFSGYATVPTDLQRKGDYGQTLINSNGTPEPATIYNPFSVTPVAGGGGVYQRAPYPTSTNGPGSVITNPDQYGLKYLSAFPEPNHAPSDVYGTNNYFYNGSSPTTRNSLNTRLDFDFGKNSFYLSGGVQNGTTLGVNTWGASSPWSWMSAPNSADDNPYAAIGDIITLSPTTFIDLHTGFQRVATQTTYPNANTFSSADYSAYGMPTGVQNMIAIPGVAPSVYSLGYGGAYSQALNNAQWVWKNEHQDNYDFNGSITKVVRRWTLKEGVDQRMYFSNWQDIEWATPSLGSYSTECYCEQYTQANGNADGSLNVTPQQSGTALAMGAIGVMGYRLDPGTTTKPALAAKEFAVYTQNDWKATNKLTLNLGLRYEIQPGPTARHNRDEYSVDLNLASPFAVGLNSATQSPLAGMGRFVFPGQDGASRHLWETQYGNFSPRLGLAYMLTNLTVLRGGYGRIYSPSNTGFNANGMVYGGGAWAGGTEMTPYGLNYNGQPGGVGDAGNGRFEDQADTELVLAPGTVQSPSLYGDENGSAGVDFFQHSGYKNAYYDQWNVFVERRIHGWLASAGYVGSRGADLPWRLFPLNNDYQIPQQTLMGWRSTWLSSNGTNDPSQAQVANPMPALINLATGPIAGSTITAMQASEGYLDLLSQTVIASKGSSLYKSLELQLKHSYSTGLTAQFTYDWSNVTGVSGGAGGASYAESQQGTLAGSGGVNYADLQSNKGLLGYDVPQRFIGVVSYLDQWGRHGKYELGNPIARELAGGWQLGTVVTLQTGQPWGPSCSSMNSNCIPTGQPLEVPKTLQHWYDGSTTVTLPDGHQVTPPNYTYLKWNPDAFTNQIVQFPNGSYGIDQYWNGTTKMYQSNLRLPAFQNTNLNITRQFTLREQYKLELLAEATNLFNHQNFLPSAVNNSYGGPILAPTAGAAIGQNGNPSAGTLSPSMMDPRQITATLRFTF
jgi:hypothetical protein